MIPVVRQIAGVQERVGQEKINAPLLHQMNGLVVIEKDHVSLPLLPRRR